MLLHIKLSTPLLNLALIMNLSPLRLLAAITSSSSSDLSKTTLQTIGSALPEVLQLSLSLSTLATQVLVFALLAQVLVTDEVSQRLLRGADSLIPGAGGALLTVLGCRASVGVGREGA